MSNELAQALQKQFPKEFSEDLLEKWKKMIIASEITKMIGEEKPWKKSQSSPIKFRKIFQINSKEIVGEVS